MLEFTTTSPKFLTAHVHFFHSYGSFRYLELFWNWNVYKNITFSYCGKYITTITLHHPYNNLIIKIVPSRLTLYLCEHFWNFANVSTGIGTQRSRLGWKPPQRFCLFASSVSLETFAEHFSRLLYFSFSLCVFWKLSFFPMRIPVVFKPVLIADVFRGENMNRFFTQFCRFSLLI